MPLHINNNIIQYMYIYNYNYNYNYSCIYTLNASKIFVCKYAHTDIHSVYNTWRLHLNLTIFFKTNKNIISLYLN